MLKATLISFCLLSCTLAHAERPPELVAKDPEHNMTLTKSSDLYTLKIGDKKVCYFIKRPDGYGVSAPVCLDDGRLIVSSSSSN